LKTRLYANLFPAEPPVDAFCKPDWRGKVKEGTRPAQAAGAKAFTFPC